MKILKYISFAAVLLMLAASCRDEIDTYSGRDNVYFFFGYGYTGVLKVAGTADSDRLRAGSTGFDFARIYMSDGVTVAADSLIAVQIYTNGKLSDKDRKVAVTVEPNDYYTTAQEGVDFEIMDAYIMANRPYGYVYVKLNNTANLTAAKTNGLNIKLKLIPNENFATDYDLTPVAELNDEIEEIYLETGRFDEEDKPIYDTVEIRRYNSLNYKLNYNNAQAISPLWQEGIPGSSSTQAKQIFGAYSLRKLQFINETFNYEWTVLFPDAATLNGRTPVSYWDNVLGWGNITSTLPIMRAMNKAMILWKDAHRDDPNVPKDDNGNPIMVDEAGGSVTFPMTSFVR